MPPAPTPCIVFDFDGTLTRHGTYLVNIVNTSLTGPLREELDHIDATFGPKAKRHELTVHEEHAWGTLTFDAYIRHGLTRGMIDDALRNVKLRPDAVEFLAYLDRMQMPWAIVSYGFKPFIERVLWFNGVGVFSEFVYAAMLDFDDDGRMIGYDEYTYVVPEKKGLASREFARLCGTPDDLIYAVGDGEGDRFLGYRKENRLGIFETSERLRNNRQHFGHSILIGESIIPAAEWLCDKTRLPPFMVF